MCIRDSIKDVRIADLRSLIGNVNQEAILFNDTFSMCIRDSTYGGRTYYFNEGYMKSSFDAVLEQTSKRGISVAGILLVPPT